MNRMTVIGAGHNGLTRAAYLVKTGRNGPVRTAHDAAVGQAGR